MKSPDLVAECVAAMGAAVKIPVTVKCRIGVDDQNPEEALPTFVDTVAKTGCDVFIVHARMAWLEGLSPKENREISATARTARSKCAANRSTSACA
jgi:tRNA-dihydrouridine synthase A